MSIKLENAKNAQYIFQYKNDSPSEVITYMKHLIKSIQEHYGSANNTDIKNFNADSVTSEMLEDFATIAKNYGYTIYQVREL